MSWVWKAATPLLTEEQVCTTVMSVSATRNLDDLASVLALMCIRQESNFWCPWNAADPSSQNYPHDSQSNDGRSVAYLQQQNGRAGDTLPPDDKDNWWGPMACRMDLRCSVDNFLDRLSSDYIITRDAVVAAQFIQRVQGSKYPAAYEAHWDYCWALLNRVKAGGVGTITEPPDEGTMNTVPTSKGNNKDPRLALLAAARPEFNEFANWCPNNGSRSGFVVDCLLAHTQEGGEDDDGAALGLSNFCNSTAGGANPVSYHYAIHQASDGGVTVVDMVDTDMAAWAVGNSNKRSINYCIAGSLASWPRARWLAQAKAINVMAYLMVQDAIKYGIDPTRINFGPNYDVNLRPPVVADHRYCTKVLKDGNNHVDVGDGFPVDVLTISIGVYWAAANSTAPPVIDPGTPPVTVPVDPGTPPVVTPPVVTPPGGVNPGTGPFPSDDGYAIPKPKTTDALINDIWNQLFTRWNGRTLAEWISAPRSELVESLQPKHAAAPAADSVADAIGDAVEALYLAVEHMATGISSVLDVIGQVTAVVTQTSPPAETDNAEGQTNA